MKEGQGDKETGRQGDKGISRSVSLSPRLLVSLSLLLIPFVYFYPVLLGQITLAPGDGWAQNLGVRALAGQMLARGEWPLWNPYIFAGMPLAASVYPGAFYPPNWLFVVLSPRWAMNIVVLTTYHVALVGTYLYARRIGITRVGALLAGMAFTFGGFMINHLSHTSRVAAAAWLPWVLLAIENCRAKCQFAPDSVAGSRRETGQTVSLPYLRLWRWVCLGALFIALQFFAGEPQMVIFTGLVAAPCALFALWQCTGKAARLRFIAALSVMLVGSALLIMIQLLPSLELLAQSERSDPGPLFFDTHSFPPWQLPALLFPYFFGGAMFPPYHVPNWGADMPAIMAGYVGMLVWLLAVIAIFSLRRKAFGHAAAPEGAITWAVPSARVWLWLGIAVVALLLAFGGYLPFRLNHLLYRVPGYKTFRGLYRHQFEFTFALGILAGLGLTRLIQLPLPGKRRALQLGTLTLTIMVAAIAILYLFFGDSLATHHPRPPQAASPTNAEFLIPLACFALSIAALWFYTIKFSPSPPPPLSPSFFLLAVLLLDLASYGHFFHWRTARFDVAQRLADPPAVQLIKAREPDWHSFRVMSHPALAYDYAVGWPEDPNFELLNQPNISILRGLQSVSGYDVLRPVRTGELLGSAGSALAGFVQDIGSFGLADRGLDLLNVKYLIVGHVGSEYRHGYTFDGVYFARTNFNKEFKPGTTLTTEPGGVAATELAVVSTLANSGNIPDGAPVLRVRLHTRAGEVIERELQAGRDTSEWAYDRADVRATVQHGRARIAESTPAAGFAAHNYLGRLSFDRAEIEKIEWSYAGAAASLYLTRASLHDATTGLSVPLANLSLPPERWRKRGRFAEIEVYENLRVLPRAWFAEQLVTLPDDQALQTIKAGALPDGAPFDPRTTALLKSALPLDAQAGNDATAGAAVKIARYEAQRIELETNNARAGLLVLSEIAYDGWQARIDGQPAEVRRVNYTLRGVAVPAGEHRVELVYRPRSFRQGALCFALGLGLLALLHPRVIRQMVRYRER